MGSKRTERSLQEIVVGISLHSLRLIGCYSATLESICSYVNPSTTSLTDKLFMSPLSQDGHQWWDKFSSRFMPVVVFFNTTRSTWMLEGYLAPQPPFLSLGFRAAAVVSCTLLAVPRRSAGEGARVLVGRRQNEAARERGAEEMVAL